MFIFWIVFLIRLLIWFHNHLFHSILLQICVEFQNLHCPSIWLIPQIPPFRFRVEFALLEKDSGTNLYIFGWFPAFYWRNITYHCSFHCKWKCYLKHKCMLFWPQPLFCEKSLFVKERFSFGWNFFGWVYSEWPWTWTWIVFCQKLATLYCCRKSHLSFILNVKKHSIYMKPLVQVYI